MISCLFRKPGEFKDRVLSPRSEATSRYELPAHSETAVSETRWFRCCAGFADSVHCKSLTEREDGMKVASIPLTGNSLPRK